MSRQKNCLILGATGMVGSEVLTHLLSDHRINHVTSIVRRNTEVHHPKLTEIIHDNFYDFSSFDSVLQSIDLIYYCLGVYQTKVSSRDFWAITVGIQDALLSMIEKSHPNITFCLLSAQGADPTEKSPLLFAKAKGRAEQHLSKANIKTYYIFRPGYIHPYQNKHKNWSTKLFAPLYFLYPSIGIDAQALGQVIANTGMEGHRQPILYHKDIRESAAIHRANNT